MRVNLLRVIRDVVILWALIFIGGFVVGYLGLLDPEPGVALKVATVISLVVGFTISGCMSVAWKKHVFVVAVGYWITNLIVRVARGERASNIWLWSLAPILLLAYIGWALSYFLVQRRLSKEERDQKVGRETPVTKDGDGRKGINLLRVARDVVIVWVITFVVGFSLGLAGLEREDLLALTLATLGSLLLGFTIVGCMARARKKHLLVVALGYWLVAVILDAAGGNRSYDAWLVFLVLVLVLMFIGRALSQFLVRGRIAKSSQGQALEPGRPDGPERQDEPGRG
jgi:hypothetical protein